MIPTTEKIDNEIVQMLEKLRIKPAIKNGNPVKFNARYVINKRGYATDLISSVDYSNEKRFFEQGKQTNDKTYFVAVEQMPEPIGGIRGIQDKIVYPEIAKRAGIEGRVYVLAFINKEGDSGSNKDTKRNWRRLR